MDAIADPTTELDLLLRDDRDGIAWLTLNRPRARNALSQALMAELDAALASVAGDPAVRVVVLAGAGPAFCSGHDLRELQATGDAQALFDQCSALMLRLGGLPQPVIACVHGIATAAGCQLVAACDMAVAANTASFAVPGVNLGLFCSTPAVELARAVGPRAAMDMLLTGTPIDAARAHALGLVQHVVSAAALHAHTRALAARIAGKSARVVALGKRIFREQVGLDRAGAYRVAGTAMACNLALPDAAEGIAAFLDKRPPVWPA